MRSQVIRFVLHVMKNTLPSSTERKKAVRLCREFQIKAEELVRSRG